MPFSIIIRNDNGNAKWWFQLIPVNVCDGELPMFTSDVWIYFENTEEHTLPSISVSSDISIKYFQGL